MFSFIRAIALAASCGVAAAGNASAVPLQVTGEDLVFSSNVNLGGSNLSSIGFSFTATIESSGDENPADGRGTFITGPMTFTLATGESFTALAGELRISFTNAIAFGGGINFDVSDVDGPSIGFGDFFDFPSLFDVNAPTPGVLSTQGSDFFGNSSGTIDFGADGLLTYSGPVFGFGDDPTITFSAVSAVPVPAPASLPLFLVGLGALAFLLRWRLSA